MKSEKRKDEGTDKKLSQTDKGQQRAQESKDLSSKTGKSKNFSEDDEDLAKSPRSGKNGSDESDQLDTEDDDMGRDSKSKGKGMDSGKSGKH